MPYENIINSRFSEPAAIISYKDGAIKLLAVNDNFLPELWMDITKDDFIKEDFNKGFDEDTLRLFTDAVKKCVDSGKEQTVEIWRQTFSDCCGYEKICIRSRLIPVEKTDEGTIIYEGVRNVTNERRMQTTLDDIEYRYKQASEQINIYNWEYTIATKEMRPCFRCMRDLGLPALVTNYPEPVIDAGIFPPDYADMYREMMRKIDEGAPELEADIPLTVGRIPFRIKYTTEFDDKGKPVRAFGSATLISETELGHIRLDNQIIASLAEGYRCIYLLDFVSDTVKSYKEDPVLLLKESEGCSGLIAMMSDKLKGSNKEAKEQDALPYDVKTVRTELFKDCDKREFVYKDETENRWVRIDCLVMERSADKVDRMLMTTSVIDDLRAQKMDADRLIATQKEELEDRQTMLLAAIDEANRANKAKTEFFSNMSHDIRTPMSAITGFSRLAMDDIDNKDQLKDYLERIVAAGDHLMDLINDILDMSSIESGKMEIVTAPLKLKELLLKCADMVRVKMDENKIDFHVDVEAVGDDTVECDQLRFSQVVLNLLSNAYKFTPEGGSVYLEGRLLGRGPDGYICKSDATQVSLEKPGELKTGREEDNYIYEIRVRDTGIGMSEEFLKHIWEAYSREKTEIIGKTQGTGLGMAIVQSIVNLMQGTIDVDSQPGKGSEFIIVVPLRKASDERRELPQDKLISDALNRTYEGVTVLVVDDSATNLKLAELVLGKFRFSVRKSNNAIDAIQIIRDSKPGDIDLILMDVMMPVMDGLEATRRIRALEDQAKAGIPIVAMTANAFESDVQEALDAGMNAYVTKPFRKEDLIYKINANLKQL